MPNVDSKPSAVAVFVFKGFTPALHTTACKGGIVPALSLLVSSAAKARTDVSDARSRDIASTWPATPASLVNLSTAACARPVSRQARTTRQGAPCGDFRIALVQANPRPVLPPVITTVREPVP